MYAAGVARRFEIAKPAPWCAVTRLSASYCPACLSYASLRLNVMSEKFFETLLKSAEQAAEIVRGTRPPSLVFQVTAPEPSANKISGGHEKIAGYASSAG
jgi:hypothetical protein